MPAMSTQRLTCLALAIAAACAGAAAVIPVGPAPDPDRPLSAMVAVVARADRPIPALVRERVDRYTRGRLPEDTRFPLPNTSADAVRALDELVPGIVAKWLDPLTPDTSASAPRYGANNDYIAYFGDGWDRAWQGGVVGNPPQFAGDGRAGWVWVNHEYLSNADPTTTSAPQGQHLTLARFLRAAGLLAHDVDSSTWPQAAVDAYVRQAKRQLGGSWFRVRLDPASRRWRLVPDRRAVRYDATSDTLLTLTGQRLRAPDHDDAGHPLPPGVVAGIAGDCAGAQTPWGTVITAEENVQHYYGDLEACWTPEQKLVPGQGFDPGGFIDPPVAPSAAADFGQIGDPNERHARDVYGYLVEIDPGVAPGAFYRSVDQGGTGAGHRKIGAMGRARWENAAIVTGADGRLLPDQPIVLYGGDDRRGGRIYKWVSRMPYRAGMTRGQVRALLDEGALSVAHFAGLDNATGLTLRATGALPSEQRPGEGLWILLSTASADVAPNAVALGAPGTTVGAALRNVTWNGLGGFRDDHDVRLALFTAANKIGVMELNRPEDLEWNARDPSGRPRLYVAFTNHTRQVALSQAGALFDPARHATDSPRRQDREGAIFALEEADPARPAASRTFRYVAVWRGVRGTGPFDAANPDNLLIDGDGGVWFGTDDNLSLNGTSDAFYYLDLDPAHRQGAPGVVRPTHGKAFRIVAGPSDAEVTGPAWSSDQRTLFLDLQHPGEEIPSTWPQER